MRYRTKLTAPPEAEAEPVTDSTADAEYYSPGFGLPREPRIWSRAQRRTLATALILIAVLAAVGLFRVATAGQAEDPAMERVDATVSVIVPA